MKVQPNDQGIIRSLKSKFRSRLGRLLLNVSLKEVDLYKALLLTKAAWNEVSSDTVKNFWRKSGLVIDEQPVEDLEIAEEEDDDSEIADL